MFFSNACGAAEHLLFHTHTCTHSQTPTRNKRVRDSHGEVEENGLFSLLFLNSCNSSLWHDSWWTVNARIPDALENGEQAFRGTVWNFSSTGFRIAVVKDEMCPRFAVFDSNSRSNGFGPWDLIDRRRVWSVASAYYRWLFRISWYSVALNNVNYKVVYLSVCWRKGLAVWSLFLLPLPHPFLLLRLQEAKTWMQCGAHFKAIGRVAKGGVILVAS